MPSVDPVEDFRQWDQAGGWRAGAHAEPGYAAKMFAGWTEKQFIDFSLKGLQEHFHVKREQWGTCLPFSQVSRKRIRVDLICSPKAGVPWGLGSFAVEYKRPDRPATAKLGDHIAQAMDYRATYFDGCGYMPVFLCPGLQGYSSADACSYADSNKCIHYESARRILGALGIGEMFVADDGNISLYLSAEQLIVRGRITRNAMVQKKVGRGVGSASR